MSGEMAMMKIRKSGPGRPLLPGKREASGRLSRNAADKDYRPPASIVRMMDDALRGYQDAIFGTPLGRMALDRTIDGAEFEAGKKWGKIVRDYHLATGAPSPDPHSIVIGAIGSRQNADPESEEGQRQAKKDRGAVNRFKEAHAIMLAHGMLAERDTRALCEGIGEYPRGYEALCRVRGVLSGLAKFWQLTRR